MITMKPILEQDVLALLADGRFSPLPEGYIMADGGRYLGYSLFRVENGVTTVLDAQAEDNMMLDGLVRAAVAKGESAGAAAFCINREIPALRSWAEVFVPGEGEPINNTKIFGNCG